MTFNSNGNYTLLIASSNTTIQGGYTVGPPVSNTGQALLTLNSQGQVLFLAQAVFLSPGEIIFSVGTDNIPGATFITQVFFGRID